MPYPHSVPSRSSSRAAASPAGHGELALLGRIRARAGRVANVGLRLGIGDDCALIRIRPGEELAVTTDLSIAGRHFQLAWHPPESVGHRTLARGLSDLAAMGARPIAAFLSLGLPKPLAQGTKMPGPRAGSQFGDSQLESSWLDRFLDGFFALAGAAATPLAGGDLAESPVFAADIVLLGAVRRGRALLRSAAKPGHLICVTGALGASAAGLAHLAASAKRDRTVLKEHGSAGHVLKGRDSIAGGLKGHDFSRAGMASIGKRGALAPEGVAPLLAAHLYPQPRLAQGQALARRRLASAAIDISDGLSTDLAHLCEESRVAAEIDLGALPVHPAATLHQALHGGEDYELLFTAPPSARIPRAIAGVPITRIGRILRPRRGRAPITILTPQGPQPLAPSGWEHFASPASSEPEIR